MKPSEKSLSPTRAQLIAMLGDLVNAARQVVQAGNPSPDQRKFHQAIGKLCADMAGWEEEDFTFEDGVVYVILDRINEIDVGKPLLVSSLEAAEKYCRLRCEQEFGAGKFMFTDKSIGGVTAYYANGREVFNVMPEGMVG